MNIPEIDPFKIAKELGIEGIVFTFVGIIVALQFIGPIFTLIGDVISFVVIIAVGIPLVFIIINVAIHALAEVFKEANKQYREMKYRVSEWWDKRNQPDFPELE